MGALTHDLARLRNEILALRSARQGLIHDLEQETGDRRTDVSQMLANFSKTFGAVARKTKADCRGSISDLKRTVNALLTGVRTDLSGIRQTWLALGTPSRRAVEELENQARREAGVSVEGRPSETGTRRAPEVVGGEKPARRKRKR
jgi:hypothetical protein